jgi:hypothetical protein
VGLIIWGEKEHSIFKLGSDLVVVVGGGGGQNSCRFRLCVYYIDI